MFWADRTNKLAGVTLLLMAVIIIINIVLIAAAVGDGDPTNRGDLEGILNDIHDNKALYISAIGFSIVADAVLLPLAATLLYLVFRGRNGTLALVGMAGFLAAGVAFVIADSADIAGVFLAEDFVKEGGAGGIAAGDPVILQSARAVGTLSAAMEVAGSMPIALAFLALGSLLSGAPSGETNPPRWMGWLGILTGLGLALQWTEAANEGVGIAVTTVGYIGAIVWFAVLGGWLVIQPERGAEPAGARTAPASV